MVPHKLYYGYLVLEFTFTNSGIIAYRTIARQESFPVWLIKSSLLNFFIDMKLPHIAGKSAKKIKIFANFTVHQQPKLFNGKIEDLNQNCNNTV